MALMKQDQFTVALYYQTRLSVHTQKLIESCDKIERFIQAVRPDLVTIEIRIIVAEQMILRELLYGAKYLISKEVFASKISFDEKTYLDPEFYTKRKEELMEENNA